MAASRHRFTATERWAIYSTHGDVCYLCRKEIDLMNMEVDHVIPESLLADIPRLTQILAQYGLPSDFDLNSYANWMPACGPCNRAKSNDVFEYVPGFQLVLMNLVAKAPDAAAHAQKSKSNKEVAKLLNAIERALNIRGIHLAVMAAVSEVSRKEWPVDVPLEIPLGPSGVVKVHKQGGVSSTSTIKTEQDGHSSVHVLSTPRGDVEISIDTREEFSYRINVPVLTYELKSQLGFLEDLQLHLDSDARVAFERPADKARNLPAIIYSPLKNRDSSL